MKVKMRARCFAILIAVVLLAVAALPFVSGGGKIAIADVSVSTTANDDMKTYEIYPTPHSIVYGDTTVTLSNDVDVSIGERIDDATRNKLFDALSLIDVTSSREAAAGNTKVLLGVYGSGDGADAFVSQNVSVPAGHFDKIDAYVLYIGGGTIAVLGKDTDAAFYGVSTLDMILTQADGKSVRALTVLDYSDSVYRGFIEGYYGTPWTTDERIELMRFGSKFKTNIYIYAPKDDPYHSRNWRGLYTGADLAALKEQIKAGTETKTRFTWSVHPLMENSRPFKRATYAADLTDLLKKLQQIYDAGCRSFMVSADDIPPDKVDAACQRDMLNDVQAWLKAKGDCFDLIFVSSSYCEASQEALGVDQSMYYAELMDGLDADIEIMWTGNKVCSRLSDGAYDSFDALTGGRRPFFWMNWPVTDYNPTYLLLGGSEVLDVKTDNGQVPFSGVVLNPMEYAEMSKISIFGVGDYCWNIDAFDVQKNYADSFKYIDDGAPQALYELSKHLSNTTGKIGDSYFAESTELRPYIKRFEAAYGTSGFDEAAKNLSNQLDVILSACYWYEKDAQNAALLKTIAPWLEALKRMAGATQQYIRLLLEAKDTGADKAALTEKYNAANALYESVSECVCPVLKSWAGTPLYEPVHIAPTYLTPFTERLREIIIEDVAVPLGIPTGITVKGFGALYGGTGPIENILDGDPETYVWFDGRPEDGSFVRIDLGETIDLDKLRVLSGKPASAGGGDVMKGYVDYSVDGVNYTTLCDLTGADTALRLAQAVKARYIRIVSRGATTWAALSEVYVNDLAGLKYTVSTENFGGMYGNTSPYSILDGDDDTYAWFTRPSEAGGYIQIDLGESKRVSSVTVLTGTPSGEGQDDNLVGHIEYSEDGVGFTRLDGSFDGSSRTNTITLTAPVDARYIRIVNDGTPHYIAIREVKIN